MLSEHEEAYRKLKTINKQNVLLMLKIEAKKNPAPCSSKDLMQTVRGSLEESKKNRVFLAAYEGTGTNTNFSICFKCRETGHVGEPSRRQ